MLWVAQATQLQKTGMWKGQKMRVSWTSASARVLCLLSIVVQGISNGGHESKFLEGFQNRGMYQKGSTYEGTRVRGQILRVQNAGSVWSAEGRVGAKARDVMSCNPHTTLLTQLQGFPMLSEPHRAKQTNTKHFGVSKPLWSESPLPSPFRPGPFHPTLFLLF